MLVNQRWDNRGLTRWQQFHPRFIGSIPKSLVLAYYADNPLSSKRGPAPTYTTTPLSINRILRGDPAYTNALPSGSEDMTSSIYWDGNNLISATGDGALYGEPAYQLETEVGIATNIRYSPKSHLYKDGVETTVSFILERGVSPTYQIRGASLTSHGRVDVDFDAETITTSDGTVVAFSNVTMEMLSTTTAKISYSVTVTGDLLSSTVSGIGFNSTTVGLTCRVSSYQVVESPYLFPYIQPGTSSEFYAGAADGSGISFDTSGGDISNTTNIHATPTISILPKMGVGSTEMVDGDSFNLMTADDTALHGLFCGCDATGSYLAISDGTNTSKVYTTWGRGSYIILGLTTPTDSTMQLHYQRFSSAGEEIDATLQSTTAIAFDGAIDTGTYLRLFYENTAPLGLVGLEIFNTLVEPDEMTTRLIRKMRAAIAAEALADALDALDHYSDLVGSYASAVGDYSDIIIED